MAFDPHLFKQYFPLFSQPENQSLVYCDNAATTQKPQAVLDAIMYFYTHQNGNAQRSSHRLSRLATEKVATVRKQAADFLGVNSPENIIFTSGATEALNLIAHGLSVLLSAEDEILLSHLEHHANLLPWQRLADQTKAQLRFFPEHNGQPNWQQWESVITDNTRILAISGASNVTGQCLDLRIIADIKQRYPGIIVVLDASQMAAHLPIAADRWACDFLVCSAHKFYGPTGVGLLYTNMDKLHHLPPLRVGGEMVTTVERYNSEFTQSPQRFEAGTSPLAAIAGLGGCLEFWQQQDRQAMMAYERDLTTYLHEQLETLGASGLKLITTADNNVGIATVVGEVNEDSNGSFSLTDLAHWLDEHDIAVRVGNHCAQPYWQSLSQVYGVNKGLRISLAAYNTFEDVDRLIDVINTFFDTSSAAMSENISLSISLSADDLSHLDYSQLSKNQSWPQRYKTLLRWGNSIHPKPEIRQPANRVDGCESDVWLTHTQEQNRHQFFIDSDSNVIKGLSALLLVWFNNKTAEQIHAIDVEAELEVLGLSKHLSPSRVNGFGALLKKMKTFAVK